MVQCFLCEQEIPQSVPPIYKYGRAYCTHCAAKFERISHDLVSAPGPALMGNLQFADIMGIGAFCAAILGVALVNPLLWLIAFIMSFIAIGKERWPFGAIIFYTGMSILCAIAVVALIAIAYAFLR